MNPVERLEEIKSKIPSNIKVVAVSKTKPATMVEDLYLNSGHKIFGENRVQELESKQTVLPKDIEWHLIGHLQTNKVKFVVPYIGMIQSVDSLRLLKEINSEAAKKNRVISCLLQFHIAEEESKFGFSLAEACTMLDNELLYQFKNVEIKGVMGIATYTPDVKKIQAEFRTLYKTYDYLRKSYFSATPGFSEISMGMTNDFQLAVEEGSTILRIGSGIFGER
jgi:pyridoxal phosphate enzyme (YggS family)